MMNFIFPMCHSLFSCRINLFSAAASLVCKGVQNKSIKKGKDCFRL